MKFYNNYTHIRYIINDTLNQIKNKKLHTSKNRKTKTKIFNNVNNIHHKLSDFMILKKYCKYIYVKIFILNKSHMIYHKFRKNTSNRDSGVLFI